MCKSVEKFNLTNFFLIIIINIINYFTLSTF